MHCGTVSSDFSILQYTKLKKRLVSNICPPNTWTSQSSAMVTVFTTLGGRFDPLPVLSL